MIRTNTIKNNIPGLLTAFFLALITFISNFSVKGPMIQADEGSYLANAAAIAGFHNDLASSYSAGYSLFIAPAFWMAHTPENIIIWVKFINTILYFITVVLLWFTAKDIQPESSTTHRMGAVVVAALYPMWVIMVGYSFAQIAFVPVFMLIFLSIRHLIKDGCHFWVSVGILGGILYWIHPTATAVVLSLILTCGYIAVTRRKFISFIVFLVTLSGMIALYKYGFLPWLNGRMTISGAFPVLHYPSLSNMLSPLGSLQGLKEVAVHLTGHIFYLMLGTAGLIGAGLIAASQDAFAKDHFATSDLRIAIAVFLWLSTLGTLALSVLLFSSAPEAQRLDHWMYGRYVEGVIPPILLIGALRKANRDVLWILPIFLFCTIIFWLGLGEYQHTARFNVSAFWQEFHIRDKGVLAWSTTGFILITAFSLLPRKIGLSFLSVLFIYASFLQILWHSRASKAASKRWDSALKVRQMYPPGTCVGFDHSGIDTYSKHVYWFDYSFVLFDYRLQRMPFDKWLTSCDGPLFSYDKNLNERIPEDISAAAIPQQGGPILWTKGEHLLEHYPMVVKDRLGSIALALGPGWHHLEQAHVWSSQTCELTLPVPNHCRQNRCFAVLQLSAYGASATRPVQLFVKGQDRHNLVDPVVFNDSKTIDVPIPLNTSRSTQKIFLLIPEATSPKILQGANDARMLGVALHKISMDSPSRVENQL